jgi:hypothetical protein
MNIKEIKELIEVVSQHGITDLEVERSGVKVRIRKEGQPVVVSSVGPAHSSYAFPTGIHLPQHPQRLVPVPVFQPLLWRQMKTRACCT